jgi:zona occludens toxin
MLYLRTGGNGSCKTLFTLRDVRDMQVKENRPVCFNGRFDMYPEKVAEFGWRIVKFEDWEDQPDGTIFIMDECHNDLPLRPASSKVPRYVSQLGEHRKRGFDFFLLTQHPRNIDGFVRNLIQPPGYHQHFKRVFGGTKVTSVLQWDAVNVNCEKDGSGKSAQISRRTHPVEVYDWYKSAYLHTEKVRIPKQVYIFLICIVLFVAMIYYAIQRLKPSEATQRKPVAEKTAPGHVQAAPQPVSEPARAAMTTAEYIASFQPRIEGMPQTAPRYDDLTKPSQAPYPAACVHMAPRCQCYSQQGTKLEVLKATCLQIVEKGFFMDWQAGPTNAAQPVNHSMPQQAQQVAASGPVMVGMQADSH